MNRSIVILMLLFAGGCLSVQSAPKDVVDHYQQEREADVVIYCDPTNRRPMKIRFGPRKEQVSGKFDREVNFSADLKSLKNLFNDRPGKGLVVMVYEKSVLDESDLELAAARHRDYFVARGYKRVSIRRANSAGPPILLLEYPERKAARPKR